MLSLVFEENDALRDVIINSAMIRNHIKLSVSALCSVTKHEITQNERHCILALHTMIMLSQTKSIPV